MYNVLLKAMLACDGVGHNATPQAELLAVGAGFLERKAWALGLLKEFFQVLKQLGQPLENLDTVLA